MTEPTSPFEDAFAARLRAHLDGAVEPVDAAALTSAAVAEAERMQPVRPTGVRWAASPPAGWRPVAAVAALLAVTLGVAMLAGAPNRPAPSRPPTSTAAVVVPSTRPRSDEASPTPRRIPMRLAANGLLAWSNDGRIRLITADGTEVRAFGSDAPQGVLGATPGEPAWSPFGDWLAFNRYDGDHGSIARIRSDGTGAELLTGPELNVDSRPVWSPDAAWLAFTVETAGGYEAVVLHLATRRTAVVATGRVADWAPDSRRLVIVDGPPMATRLAVTDIEGRSASLTDGFADDAADWSPVDDTILFTRWSAEDGRSTVMSIRADGTGVRQAISRHGDVSDEGPAWDPFGERIAFNRTGSEGGPVGHVASASGRDPQPALRGLRWGGHWSPDGRLAIVDATRPDFGGLAEWTTVDVATGARGSLELSATPLSASGLSWQPLRYAVTCGDLGEAMCRDQAIGIAASAMEQHPDKRILSIDVETPCGSYALAFTDGFTMGADIDCVRP